MDCVLNLLISNYNSVTKKVELLEIIPLAKVSKDDSISLDSIAEAISKLSKEDRSILAAQLRAAKIQKVTDEMISERQIISNISISDLIEKYPDLSKYKINTDLQQTFTLLHCYLATFNGTTYKGRAVNSDGLEIFIINNFYDAERLFKHLSVKQNITNYIKGNDIIPNTELSKLLLELHSDLKTVADKFKKSILLLIEDFLINKSAYLGFQKEAKFYHPAKIISKVLSLINDETYDTNMFKSDLQLDLEAIKEPGVKSGWKFNKKRLYEVLKVHFPDFPKQYSWDAFNDLDSENLNNVLKSLFIDDVKLMRARVKSSTQGKKIIKDEPDKIVKRKVAQVLVQRFYEQLVPPGSDPNLPKKSKDLYVTDQEDNLFLNINGVNHPVELSIEGEIKLLKLEKNSKGQINIYYEDKAKPKITENKSYVILDLGNYSFLGDIYNWGYNDKPIFEPQTVYKGFQIYAYFKEGKTHYAISRHVLSPKSSVQTFSSIEAAKYAIDNKKDIIKDYGLYSIKQIKDRPRTARLEYAGVKEGLYITVLDLELPSLFKFQDFSNPVKDLFQTTVEEFLDILSFLGDDIKTLDTPEKAASFIYLTHELLKSEEDYFSMLKDLNNQPAIKQVIDKINNSEKITYLVESYDKAKGYYLKLLQNHGTNIQQNGVFPDMTVLQFLHLNLTDLINHFNKKFGIEIIPMSHTELEAFSKENNLEIENKLNTIKAFVFNGQIIINTSNAKYSDLFHELSHIFLGVLKASDLKAYLQIIDHYKQHANFRYWFNTNSKNYKHYSQLDIVEETVADIIAQDMFKHKSLSSTEENIQAIAEQFEQIMRISERFTNTLNNNNGLGFENYFKDLLDQNSNKVLRNMRISDLISKKIRNKEIIENC